MRAPTFRGSCCSGRSRRGREREREREKKKWLPAFLAHAIASVGHKAEMLPRDSFWQRKIRRYVISSAKGPFSDAARDMDGAEDDGVRPLSETNALLHRIPTQKSPGIKCKRPTLSLSPGIHAPSVMMYRPISCGIRAKAPLGLGGKFPRSLWPQFMEVPLATTVNEAGKKRAGWRGGGVGLGWVGWLVGEKGGGILWSSQM